MSTLGTGKAQEQFISIFTGEKLRASFHTYNMLESKMEYLKPAFMPDFLSKIIGKEKLNALITEERHYDRFLEQLKPLQISHVRFLKSLFSEERIRSLTQSHSYLASQLKSLPEECHLSYLKEIIGSKHLQDILSQNYCMLATVLVSIRDTDRMAMLFDILGETAVQSIIPSYGNLRAKEKIQTLIPSEQRQEFLERLLPAAEKEAREWVMGLRQSILKNQFKLGFMGKGGGGVDITLPDGSTKRVPATVGRQWEHSNNALSCSISFIEARTRMKQCVTESKNDNSLVTWFTRRSGTKKYYEQPEFKADVEDDNDWTLT